MGPFVNLKDGGILGVEGNDAIISYDEGNPGKHTRYSQKKILSQSDRNER